MEAWCNGHWDTAAKVITLFLECIFQVSMERMCNRADDSQEGVTRTGFKENIRRILRTAFEFPHENRISDLISEFR